MKSETKTEAKWQATREQQDERQVSSGLKVQTGIKAGSWAAFKRI